MKKLIAIALLTIVSTFAAFGQSNQTAEGKKILAVFNEYLEAMQKDADERDRMRERLLTEDYFYMGVDGLPADKKLVMARQKRNGLKINSLMMTDIKIRIYKDTAILTMRSVGAGVDMGKPWGDGTANGHTTVMVKRKGKWLVAADIIGREIEK